MQKQVVTRTNPLRSFLKGLLISAGLSLFLHAGILIVYYYLPASVLMLVGLILLLSLLFWISMKYDHMLDLNEVFSKTISFDMKVRNGFGAFFLRYLRPVNPYIGAVITLLVLFLLLLSVPALIIYLLTYPGPIGTLLKICVFCMSTGICVSYFYYNRDEFPSVADMFMFIAGILCGTSAWVNII